MGSNKKVYWNDYSALSLVFCLYDVKPVVSLGIAASAEAVKFS